MKLWVVNSTQDSMNECISKTTAFLSHTELKKKKTNKKRQDLYLLWTLIPRRLTNISKL